MGEKRYQVFISSTFADLETERAAVFQTLMEMDCIPAGMEAFTAVDDDQLEFIKTVINDCDYYVLIIGGRYGSVDGEGISYTQREYEYALERGIPVLAFVKRDISKLEVGKTDATDSAKMASLDAFRREVMTGRLVKQWDSSAELPGLVALGISKAIKLRPGIGWVRGNTTSSEDLLSDLNDLRKENEALKRQVPKIVYPGVENLVGLEATISLKGKMTVKARGNYSAPTRVISWTSMSKLENLFSFIAPALRSKANFLVINNRLAIAAQNTPEVDIYSPSTVRLDNSIFDTIILQFEALGLIETGEFNTISGGKAHFGWLSEVGKQKMYELRTLRHEESDAC